MENNQKQKKTYKDILIVFVIIMAILPVVVTFSAILTRFFEKMRWYEALQRYVVPIESTFVAATIKTMNITSELTPESPDYSIVLKKNGGYIPIRLEWNCLGWQSMILLLITLLTGLSGNYSLDSKIKTLILGILGTFLSNILRMSIIVALAYYWNSFGALIIHDYFASFVAIIWIMFFWWFSFKYILTNELAPSSRV